jgi:hypothetical protein
MRPERLLRRGQAKLLLLGYLIVLVAVLATIGGRPPHL